jgi:ribosomal protein L37AE/L43A
MSSTASYDSSPWPSRAQPGPTTAAHVQTDDGERRARRGLRRRGRDRSAAAWDCPGCGLPVTDRVAAGLGFCPRCQDFTGLCGAGRKLVSPDVMTRTTWHTPCTSRGAAAWQIADVAAQRVLLLCPAHDEQLRTGQAGWIPQAIPLEDPAGR